MYYDDEARRFNFISGFVLGTLLGAGLALIAGPPTRYRKPRRIRRSAAKLRRGATVGAARILDQTRRASGVRLPLRQLFGEG